MNVHEFIEYRMEKIAVSKGQLRQARQDILNYGKNTPQYRQAMELINRQKAGFEAGARIRQANLSKAISGMNPSDKYKEEIARDIQLGKTLKNMPGSGAKRSRIVPKQESLTTATEAVQKPGLMTKALESFKGQTKQQKMFGIEPKKSLEDQLRSRIKSTKNYRKVGLQTGQPLPTFTKRASMRRMVGKVSPEERLAFLHKKYKGGKPPKRRTIHMNKHLENVAKRTKNQRIQGGKLID